MSLDHVPLHADPEHGLVLAQHAVDHHVGVLGDDVSLNHARVALKLAKVTAAPLLVGDALVLLLLVFALLGQGGEALAALGALERTRTEVGGKDMLLDLKKEKACLSNPSTHKTYCMYAVLCCHNSSILLPQNCYMCPGLSPHTLF